MSKKINHVSSLVLEVTRRCNMQCEHCLRGCSQSADMDKQLVDTILTNVESIGSVTFSGGEPTLNLPIIEYFFEQASWLGVGIGSFFVATNGLVNQFELAKILMERFDDMDDKEYCEVSLSTDAFHTPVKNFLKHLSFYSESKEYEYNESFEHLINVGFAKENGIGDKNRRIPAAEFNFDIESSYNFDVSMFDDEALVDIEMLYISATGLVAADCDCSYDMVDAYGMSFESFLANLDCIYANQISIPA